MGKVTKRITVIHPCEYIYETASHEEVDKITGYRVDRRKNYKIYIDSSSAIVLELKHKQEGKKIFDYSRVLASRKAYYCKCLKVQG